MADQPKFNVENPPKPSAPKPVPAGLFYLPGAATQPLIDPLTGSLIQPTPAPQPGGSGTGK
jgi:hypothetical protein